MEATLYRYQPNMSGRKSGGSKLDRFISTHKPHEAEIMAAQADGVMSAAESTLLGADFCPSVAASQYTAGTTEMDDYNKSFLEKVAAGARQESMQHKRVETPTIDEDDEEDQEPGALSSPNNRSAVPHGGSTNHGPAQDRLTPEQGPDDEMTSRRLPETRMPIKETKAEEMASPTSLIRRPKCLNWSLTN